MKTTLLTAFFFLFVDAFAQNGTPDFSFNQSVVDEFIDGSGPSGGSIPSVNAIKVQPDGKVLVAGDFFYYNRSNTGSIVRLFPNGSLDSSFHFGNANGGISSLLVQPDGKVIIGGSFTYYFGQVHKYLLRLDSNGELDPTFNTGTGVNDGGSGYVTDLALDADGKIVVAGNFATFNGVSKPGIVRLNTDGSIDNTFDTGTGPNTGIILGIEKTSDGGYFLGGSFTDFNGTSINSLVRVNSVGAVDGSFSTGFPANNVVSEIKINGDGDIYAGGGFTEYYGTIVGTIILLHPDGTQNTVFSPVPIMNSVSGFEITPENRVVVVGSFSASNGDLANHIICLEPDGSMSTVVNFGTGFNSEARTVTIKDDGKMIVGGPFELLEGVYRPCLVQFNTNGVVDPEFLPVPGTDAMVNKIIALADGKSIVAGNFKHYNGHPCSGVVRLNADGTVDNTFQFSQPNVTSVDDIILLPNGEYALIYFSLANQNDGIIKINNLGNVDTNFVFLAQGLNDFQRLNVQSDGKLLVSGWIDITGLGDYNGGVIRLDADGTQEPGFLIELSENAPVYAVDILPDGKIMVAGYNEANGTQWGSVVVRVLSDGTPDQNFPYLFQYNGSLKDMQALPDGKIMVMGDFTSYNGFMTRHLVRLNYDGTTDETFSVPDNPAISGGQSFKMLANGKILLFGGTILAQRLNEDGTLDTDFSSYTQPGGGVATLDVQPNGSLLVGGNFQTGYDLGYRNNIVRLFNDTIGLSSVKIGFHPIEERLTCDDSAYCTAFGYFGLAPYSYEWLDNNSTDSARYFTDAGIYQLQVTDATGSSVIATLIVEGPVSQTGFDLDVNLAAQPFRPGFNSLMELNGLNYGCLPTSGVMTLVYDVQLELLDVSPTPTAISGNSLSWDFSDLTYDDFINASITFNTPDTLVIGDSLLFDLSITPTENDMDTLNNFKSYAFAVVNGYDPNFMEVYPDGKCDQQYVQEDEKLVYLVHFQNTGNSEAISIAIDNFPDADLDLSSLKIVGKSADCWTEILYNDIVRFHFDSIMLVDSLTDPIASQGYIQYEVSIAGLPHNKLLQNHAEIHFDYNPAVITNEVFNTVFVGDLSDHPCNLGIESNLAADYTVFPNPFISGIEISGIESGTAGYAITDLSGNKVKTGTLNKDDNKIDLSQLAPGVYLFQLQNQQNGLTGTKKIIRQ